MTPITDNVLETCSCCSYHSLSATHPKRFIRVARIILNSTGLCKNFREKAATYLKLAQGLSWKNPSRFRLVDMAENFQRRATELEVQAEQQRQQSQPRE